jgi:chromosome segregation ATPase
VIEFALLFGLGFLSAALLAMLIAPGIHRRIVRYTENRIKATLPISPQEVRAQRDMARAVYAAENARTKQELVETRDKAVGLQLKSDSLLDDARRLLGETADLKAQIETMDVEAADARSKLRQEDSYIQQMKATIEAAEEAGVAKDLEIQALQQRLLKLTADTDNFRIDLSGRDTEVESLKFRLSSLRDERDSLRADMRLQTTRAKDAVTRLAQEESRSQRLEDKLAKEASDRADSENALERRLQEIARLRERLKTANAEARDASRALRDATLTRPGAKSTPPSRKQPSEEVTVHELPNAPLPRRSLISQEAETNPLVATMVQDARNRATALSERVMATKSTASDESIRREMASIAADMVNLTAVAEGPTSPIRTILSGKSGTSARESLAAKAKVAMASSSETA